MNEDDRDPFTQISCTDIILRRKSEEMEADGFIMVRNRRKPRIGRMPKINCASSACATTSDTTYSSVSSALNDSTSVLTHHRYSDQVIKMLENVLNGRSVSQLRAVGVGNFSVRRSIGCLQMALFVALRNRFSCRATFQEPLVTDAEKDWLSLNNIDLVPSSDLSSEEPFDENQNSVTIFYMPHCEHIFYHNLISAQCENNLNRLIVIGNNFSNYVTVARNSININVAHLYQKYASHSLPMFPFSDTIFNDTAINFIPHIVLNESNV
ncbi:hypothetical protein AB6A40_007707 [Gnathostoma spinigerum]|uniref:SRR1-like domain-containing protein n=1 Tax=Gnathostoma spinigerum TaxID=75299 RepID=A0ABD6EVB4_9BILA